MLYKYVAWGFLIGLCIGSLIALLYPQIFMQMFQTKAGLNDFDPYDWNVLSGTVKGVVSKGFIVGGLIGAGLGFLVGKFKKAISKK